MGQVGRGPKALGYKTDFLMKQKGGADPRIRVLLQNSLVQFFTPK